MTQEALRLALDARDKAIAAIEEALAQSGQNPAATLAVREHAPVGKVAYVLEANLPIGIHKLYTTPPQRTWLGLTLEQYVALNSSCSTVDEAICSAERQLKKNNT
jgi:hypothetical protein